MFFDDAYEIGIDRLNALLTDKTTLVSLASPQNPSGRSISSSALQRVVDVVETRSPRATILVDETYRETAFDGDIPPSRAGVSPRVLTVSSLTKSHGAPGLRLGWVTATDPDLHERLRVAKFNTLVSGTSADEILGGEVLARSADILASRRVILTRTLDVLSRWAADHDDLVDFLPPEGGAACDCDRTASTTQPFAGSMTRCRPKTAESRQGPGSARTTEYSVSASVT